MGKMHELLAVEPSLAAKAEAVRKEAIGTFNKRERFNGGTKNVTYFDEARDNENTSEHRPIDTTVGAKLAYVFNTVAPYWDAFLQKEATNQSANADIVLEDGTVLAEDVPAAALLGLESRLAAIRDMLEGIPTLTPGKEWEFDAKLGAYRTVHQDHKVKTEKSKKFLEVSKATDKHPAQVQIWDADIPVARISEEEISGMISPLEKSQLLGRCDALIMAVKQARMRANQTEVKVRKIGKTLLDFITG